MGGLDLLPALGRALKSVAVLSCPVVPVLLGPSGPGRQSPSGPRGRVCRPPPGPAAVDGPDSVAPRDSAPSSPAFTGRNPGAREAGPPDTQAHREREQAQGTLGTADHDTRAEVAGANRVPLSTGTHLGTRRSGASSGPTPRLPAFFPGRSGVRAAPPYRARGRPGLSSARGNGRATVVPPNYGEFPGEHALQSEVEMHPDTARELKMRILESLRARPPVARRAGEPGRRPWVAVGLSP